MKPWPWAAVPPTDCFPSAGVKTRVSVHRIDQEPRGWRRHLAWWLTCGSGHPHFTSKCLGLIPSYGVRLHVTANEHPGAAMMVQDTGLLPLTWETWVLLSDLGFVHTGCLGHLGSEPVCGALSVCISNKQNKQKIQWATAPSLPGYDVQISQTTSSSLRPPFVNPAAPRHNQSPPTSPFPQGTPLLLPGHSCPHLPMPPSFGFYIPAQRESKQQVEAMIPGLKKSVSKILKTVAYSS